MKNILLIWFILTLFYACSEGEDNNIILEDIDSSVDCRDTNCANYTSRAAAQAAFDADPECRNDLDRDNDGRACEEEGNSVKDCASTSNCGCSGKRKAVCENDPCCKWIVGSGCECS